MTEPRPFGLMLRRPGDTANPDADWGQLDYEEGIYLAPDFTTRHPHMDTQAGSDPRHGDGWSLSLPHRCGEWVIDHGTLDEVLAEALRFRDELDQAIEALRAEVPLPDGPRYYVKVTERTGPVEPPTPWPPEGAVAVDTFINGTLINSEGTGQ
jgi:hypothetical protein